MQGRTETKAQGSGGTGWSKGRALIRGTLLGLLLGCLMASAASATPIVFQAATGENAGEIQGFVDAYRGALGALNANVAGSFGSGRREINWDGVPDALSAPNNLPANFFNTTSPRGTVFGSSNNTFQVSGDDNTGADADPDQLLFDNIDPSYSQTFATFSAQRLFTSIGTNEMDVLFFVPGSTEAALTNGFGAIFTDVDREGTTSIQYFDRFDNLLATLFVPGLNGDGTLSFAGLVFEEAVIGRVHITAGNTALAAGVRDGGAIDLVALDDFIYGEPVAVPEPSSMVLLASAIFSLGGIRKQRVPKEQTAIAL